MLRRRCGSMLIELVVALSIGLLVILQLATFLVGFVQQMHMLANNERRLLQEGVVIDLLMQDLSVAMDVAQVVGPGSALDTIANSITRDERRLSSVTPDLIRGGMTSEIELKAWRMRDGETPRPIIVSWKKIRGQVQRRVDNAATPQVFGDFLTGLRFDIEKKRVCFIDVNGKNQIISFRGR